MNSNTRLHAFISPRSILDRCIFKLGINSERMSNDGGRNEDNIKQRVTRGSWQVVFAPGLISPRPFLDYVHDPRSLYSTDVLSCNHACSDTLFYECYGYILVLI